MELIAFVCPERTYLQLNWMVISMIEWLIHTAHRGQAGRIHLLKHQNGGRSATDRWVLMSNDTMTTIKILTLLQKDICRSGLLRRFHPLTPCQPNVLYFLSYCIRLRMLFLTNLYICATVHSTIHYVCVLQNMTQRAGEEERRWRRWWETGEKRKNVTEWNHNQKQDNFRACSFGKFLKHMRFWSDNPKVIVYILTTSEKASSFFSLALPSCDTSQHLLVILLTFPLFHWLCLVRVDTW